MALFPKIRDMATPINHDGGRDLGALIGAGTGACLAFWGLPTAAHNIGIIEVVAVLFGAILGIIVGVVFGRLIDLLLAPKVEQTIQDAADKASERPRHRGKM